MKKTAILLLLANSSLWAATLPQDDGYQHTGVATCATSQCHGKAAKEEEGNVWLNEYRIWSNDDYHSRAFQVLRNDESKAIAANLGLANALNAKICLDCHADNVAAELRGQKFQLSDGVGCEACHGGAQNWLESHTEAGATHENNLSRGLYPMADPVDRAHLCLSCHLGTKDKFTTHAIMAAGHPRLSFELDTFTANQPAHYAFDADYKQRKRDYAIGYLWLVGQVEAAKRQLELIDQHQLQKSIAAGMIEFSIYDCHSCHQPMKPVRGRPNDLSAQLPSGGLRLSDQAFDMLVVAIEILSPGQSASFTNAVKNLHNAYDKPQQITAALAEMGSQLDTFMQGINATSLNASTMSRVRKTIGANCASGRYADYSSAEQAFLGMEAISYSIGDRDKILTSLDAAYATLKNEHTYEPAALRAACRTLSGVLP